MYSDITVPNLIHQARGARNVSTIANEIKTFKYNSLNECGLRRYYADRQTSPFYKEGLDDVITQIIGVVEYGDQESDKTIRSYSSNYVQIKLHKFNEKNKTKMTESSLLEGVSKINGDFDLKGTTLTDLSGIKEVTGCISIDANGSVSDLSGLDSVGTLLVSAKNEQQALDYVSKIGISPKLVKNIVFVKKYY